MAVAAIYPGSSSPEEGGFTSLIEVAVGDNDSLIDAWIYASSGWAAADLSALRAARASKYATAVSYCRRVRGYYLFRVDFFPG